MQAIILYGPPAAGKLTVSRELARLLGYRMFQNHELVHSLSELFPFDDDQLRLVLVDLAIKFRLEVYEEAAKNNVNFITTYQGGSSTKFEFLKAAIERITNHGGNAVLVQLLPSTEALFKRVTASSRQAVKIDSEALLKQELEERPQVLLKFPDTEHLTLDNTHLTPMEAAQQIVEFYQLRLDEKNRP